jgi:catalase
VAAEACPGTGRPRTAARLLAALAWAALLAGCSGANPPVDEKLDPEEMNSLPSILASARQLVDEVQKQSGPTFRRDAHAKAHGCVTAEFTVRDDLPEELRTGVFIPGHTYRAWIRFSNGNAAVLPDDKPDARGMAIKLMGVDGPKLLTSADEKDAKTQDFLMINYPVFFNRDVAEYEELIRYQADGSKYGYFLQGLNPAHWKLRELFIGSRILGRIANPLYAQYYSMTAYALGVEQGQGDPPPYRHAMKYSARGCTPADHRSPDRSQDNYLRQGLAEDLAKSDACFEFLVQVQDPTKNMPIEDPTVRWSERDAPYQRVATIRIPKQVFDTRARNTFCENLSFSPWHGHVDHRPLGGLNRIRKAVYEGIAVYRHLRNGTDFREPTSWCVTAQGAACDAELAPPPAAPTDDAK